MMLNNETSIKALFQKQEFIKNKSLVGFKIIRQWKINRE